MKNYTIEEQAEIGEKIAIIFNIAKNKKSGRYITYWGEKTAIGIYNTFKTIADKIETGEKL